MKKQAYRALLMIFVVLALSSLACQAERIQAATQAVLPTPTITVTPPPLPTATVLNGAAILAPVITRMGEIPTMHFTMSALLEGGTQPITLLGEGWSKGKDEYHYKITIDGQVSERRALSPTDLYLKAPGSDTWQRVPEDEMAQYADTPVSQIQFIASAALNPTLLGEENVDGVDCYHISFDLDMSKYLTTFSPEMSTQVDLTTATGKSEIWIGKADSLIRKWIFDLTYSVQGTPTRAQSTFLYNEFNSPVFLPDPTK